MMNNAEYLLSATKQSKRGVTVISDVVSLFCPSGDEVSDAGYPREVYGGWAYSREKMAHVAGPHMDSYTSVHQVRKLDPIGDADKTLSVSLPEIGTVEFDAFGRTGGDETNPGKTFFQISSASAEFGRLFNHYMGFCILKTINHFGTDLSLNFVLSETVSKSSRIPQHVIDSHPEIRDRIQRLQSEKQRPVTWSDLSDLEVHSEFVNEGDSRWAEFCTFCRGGGGRVDHVLQYLGGGICMEILMTDQTQRYNSFSSATNRFKE